MQMFPLSQATHLHSLIILFSFNTNGHFVMISTGPTDPKKKHLFGISTVVFMWNTTVNHI